MTVQRVSVVVFNTTFNNIALKEISGLEVHIQEDVELKFGILAPY
jgi:hypothetical protein